MWRNRVLLRSRGVALPGARPGDHFYAACDLRGIRFGGYDNPRVTGAWERLRDKTLAVNADTAVISHEVLAGADADQIRRAVQSLAPASVHVVYGARDLARQLPAVWQETLKNRRTRTYEAFLSAALQSEPREDDRRGFWRSQDPIVTLRRWESAVPAERIAVVTVPRREAPSSTLWERFCVAIGTDPAGYALDVARSNTSLPAEDAEVLRRLNRALPPDMSWPVYERVVKRRFNIRANALPAGSRLLVPDSYRAGVEERAQEIRDGLSKTGYRVCGDLDDLLPDPASFGPAVELEPDRVTDAAVEVLASVLSDFPTGHAAGRRGGFRNLLALTRRKRRA